MKNVKSKKYNNDWPIVAICYDFDKTLSPRDMQEFGLIKKLGAEPDEFWEEVDVVAKKEGMDLILSYMNVIVSRARRLNIKIKKADFRKLGTLIELFDGVNTWFERINEIGRQAHVNVEHYVISAGLQEIIEGTPIAKYFERIYASTFLYDENKMPIWPKQVVNYTAKTQYIFRISKDCPDMGDEATINEYLAKNERRIPIENFIYIGDSETDIPAMNVVRNNGGTTIGVYNPALEKTQARGKKLLQEKRIDHLVPAVYTQNSAIENLVKKLLKSIAKRK